MDNTQGNRSVERELVLKHDEQSQLSALLMLLWAGFWTGVVLCAFVLLMH
jgi:hypothetical protein